MRIYSDGIMRVDVKQKFAYHYNIKTGSFIGKTELDGSLKELCYFIKRLYAAGFQREYDDCKDNVIIRKEKEDETFLRKIIFEVLTS